MREGKVPGTLTGFGVLTGLASRSFNFFNFSIFSQQGSFYLLYFTYSSSIRRRGVAVRVSRRNGSVSVFCPGGLRGLRPRCLAVPSAPINDMSFPFFLFLVCTCGKKCRFCGECVTGPNRGFVRTGPSRWEAHYRNHRTMCGLQPKVQRFSLDSKRRCDQTLHTCNKLDFWRSRNRHLKSIPLGTETKTKRLSKISKLHGPLVRHLGFCYTA